MNRKLFISKNASEVELLQEYCSTKSITLQAQSLISFKKVDCSIDCDYDIIFFSSPRSVTFFLAQSSISTNAQIACIGQTTKNLLEELGFEVAFSDRSSDPLEVAKNFSEWANNRFVLFPISSKSNRSISRELKKPNYEETIVYDTNLLEKEIELCEIYVFTSPSNVEAYCLKNHLPQDAITIAWGKSTETALKLKKSSPIVMEEPSIDSLISILTKLVA